MKMLEAMLESSRVAARQGKPLKLWQASAIVTAISGLVLLEAVEGIHDIVAGRSHHALFYCGTAALMLITLPIHVFNFLRVKKGIRVVAPNPLLVFGWMRVPLSIKVALVGSLTLLVASMSYLTLSLIHVSLFQSALHHRAAARLLGIDIGSNLFLWLVVAFAWYLFILTHKQEPIDAITLRHSEGVWPPAPLNATRLDNKD